MRRSAAFYQSRQRNAYAAGLHRRLPRPTSQPLKIAINPAGTLLFTANQVGSVCGFAINATTGCLTAISTTPTDTVARGMTIDRTGQFLYVVTGGGGINAFHHQDQRHAHAPGRLAGSTPDHRHHAGGKGCAHARTCCLATDGGSTNNLHSLSSSTPAPARLRRLL